MSCLSLHLLNRAVSHVSGRDLLRGRGRIPCLTRLLAGAQAVSPVLTLPIAVTRYTVPVPGAVSPGGGSRDYLRPHNGDYVGTYACESEYRWYFLPTATPYTPIRSHHSSSPEEGKLPATWAVSGGVELLGLGQYKFLRG